jgi:hypothetical protein
MGARCKKPKSNRVPALCAFEQATDEELAQKTLPPEVWLRLISPTVNTETMRREGPLKDTCGLVINDVSQDERYICEGKPIPYDPVVGDLIDPKDLIMSQIGEDKVLLWAATDEMQNGEASGVLSLALWTEKGIEIHATGPLRAVRTAARMRLAYIGEFPVVIIESDKCPPGTENPADCERIAHFVPIIDRRVQELPLYEADRGCIGRAKFQLSKKTEVDLDGQWTRKFQMVRSIEIENGQIILTDLVTLDDYNRATNSSPTPFRKVTSQRPLELDLENGRLLVRDQNLWDRMLADHGSARLEGGGGAQEKPDDDTVPEPDNPE